MVDCLLRGEDHTLPTKTPEPCIILQCICELVPGETAARGKTLTPRPMHATLQTPSPRLNRAPKCVPRTDQTRVHVHVPNLEHLSNHSLTAA